MATKTVTGKLTRPGGGVIKGATVVAKISGSAVIASTQEIAPLEETTTTATDGTWSLTLQANADLLPNDTYYTFKVGSLFERTAIVPPTAGPFKLEDIAATIPPTNIPLNGHVASLLVDGAVTFSAGPFSVPAAALPESAISGLVADLAAKATDSLAAHLAGGETFTGVKHSTGGWFFDSGQVQLIRTIWLPASTGGDDSAVIQAAMDLLHTTGDLTGRVVLQSGTYFAKNLVIYTGIRLEGHGSGSTILKLPNSANTHLLSTLNFASLTGLNGQNGEHDFAFVGIALDGNRANNASGRCFRIYGYAYKLDDFIIRNAPEEGLYTEWAIGGLPTDGMEAKLSRGSIHDNGKHGWLCRGPHDSLTDNVMVWNNGQSSANTYDGIKTESLAATYSAAGIVFNNVHVYGTQHRIGFNLGDSAIVSPSCEAEGAATAQIRFAGNQTQIRGWVYGAGGAGDGIQIGDGVTSPGNWTIDSNIQGITANSINVVGDGGAGSLRANINQASGTAVNGSFAATTQVDIVKFGAATGSTQSIIPGTLAVTGASTFTGAASFAAAVQGTGSGGFNLLLGSSQTTGAQSAELTQVVGQAAKLLVHAGFATQRFFRFDRPTVTADQAGQTVTSAATVYIGGNPLTDASGGFTPTLTSAYALWVQNGSVRLDAGIGMNAGPAAAGNINFNDAALLSAGFTTVLTFKTTKAGVVANTGLSLAGDPGSGTAGQIMMGNATGIGNGAGTNLTAPAIGTGGGPASLAAANWMKVYDGTTARYIPMFS